MKRRGDLMAVFGIPIVLAACSLIGLISALTGDGWRDMLAAIGLAMPLLAISLAMRRRNA